MAAGFRKAAIFADCQFFQLRHRAVASRRPRFVSSDGFKAACTGKPMVIPTSRNWKRINTSYLYSNVLKAQYRLSITGIWKHPNHSTHSAETRALAQAK